MRYIYNGCLYAKGKILFCLESKSNSSSRTCQLIIDSRGVRSCSNFLVFCSINTRKISPEKIDKEENFSHIYTIYINIDTPFGNDTNILVYNTNIKCLLIATISLYRSEIHTFGLRFFFLSVSVVQLYTPFKKKIKSDFVHYKLVMIPRT